MPKKSKLKVLTTPNQSPADPLKYRAIELKNGLKVLLVSDPTADMGLEDDDEGTDNESMPSDEEDYTDDGEESEGEHADDDIGLRNAAAALIVGSGGFHEPMEAPGLAHFLEHMVFMGSKKYPDENYFDSYISARNGFSNAYTDAEITMYYFEVKPSAFEHAVDVWSRFYIDPLMKPDSVNREIQAVDSEFKLAQTHDENRVSGMLTKLASVDSPTYPASKFTWGNILSLKGTNDTEADAPKLYKNLLALHRKYYAAKTMALCIQSPHTLDELQKFATKYFNSIPNYPKDHVDPHSEIAEFVKERDVWKSQYGKLLQVVPVGEKISLKIHWQLEPLIDEWESDPVHYISWLVGHEGKGSIFDYLQGKGLATEISGGVDGYGSTVNKLYTLFGVEITLTEEGAKNVDHVINTVHSYIEMMRTPDEGQTEDDLAQKVHKPIWDMVAKIDTINWRTKDQEEPSETVISCAENMLKYPSEHWLDAEELPFKYNPELILRLLKTMTPERAIVLLLNPEFRAEAETKQEDSVQVNDTDTPPSNNPPQKPDEDHPFPGVDEWFGVRWRHAADYNYKFQALPKGTLYYPPLNPYLTDDSSTQTIQAEKSEVPILLKSTPSAQLYFMPDFEFQLPKSYIKALYRCEEFMHIEEHIRVALLFTVPTFMSLDLSNELYDATTAGLSHAIDMKSSGFTLETRGISATCPKLLKRMVEWVSQPDKWSEANFILAKQQVLTSFQDKLFDSSTVARDARVKFLESGATTLPELVRYFQHEDCTFHNLKDVLKRMFAVSTLDVLIQGNTNRELAVELFDEILTIQPVGGEIDELTGIKVRKLEKNETLSVQSFNTRTGDNHYVTKYYQYDACTARKQTMIELFTDIIEEPTFNELRTKRQLGYSVGSSIRNSWGVLGWAVDVKSAVSNHNMDHIQETIDWYTDEFIPNEILKKLTAKEFKTYVASAIVAKSAKDNQLRDLAKRNWGEIESNNHFFNRLEKEIDWLEALSMKEFLKFVREEFLPSCRVLQIQVHGNEEGSAAIDLTQYKVLEGSSIKKVPPQGCIFEKYAVTKNL